MAIDARQLWTCKKFFQMILISRFCYEFFTSFGRSLFHLINYHQFFLLEVNALNNNLLPRALQILLQEFV
jgi:hypothetical protein